MSFHYCHSFPLCQFLSGLWLLPDETIPEGTWLIGVGVIMLGLNAARYMYGIKMSGFTVVLGIIALSIGAFPQEKTKINSI